MTTLVLRSGTIKAKNTIQAQHTDLFRKLLLRRKLLSYATSGAAYVPFIGDGDIATELYADRKIYGADLDAARVAITSKRLKGSKVIVADCNDWPFPKVKDAFSVADFDAYSDPYESFHAFWKSANKADRMVLFFTDGHRQAIIRGPKMWIKPNGEHYPIPSLTDQRHLFNFYYQKYIKPWFVKFIKGWHIISDASYLRGMMLYWGAVIEHT